MNQNLKVSSRPTMEEKHLDSIYVMSTESAYVHNTKKIETEDLWHHVEYSKLKATIEKSMLKGLSQLYIKGHSICSGCQYGKAHKLPFKESKFLVKEPLQLVHVFGHIK